MEHNSYLSVDILESYDLFLRRKRLALLILLSVLAALMLFAAASGSSGITVSQVLETVLGRGTTQTEAIVFRVRLPRVMTAVAVGAALALSGCIMQNVLHNPLASASTLGVSQGAAFGAALAARLGVKNLVLWHTEDKSGLADRKVRYTAEAAQHFQGGIYVPDDLDVVEL